MSLFKRPDVARHQPQNVNKRHQQQLDLQDRLALVITSAVGTMYAVYFFAMVLAGWMLWQGAVAKHPFDPYPFAFLLFMGNIVQLLLMPLIMVGQNIQGRHTELRADEEYKTTTTSFHDLEQIMAHLDAQDKELLRQSAMIEDLLKAGRA
jgi:uncharacterized membrane protein